LGPDDHDRIAQAYGSNLARLRDVKQRFDPRGLFSATPLPV
jgi:FAD/FMN-containing dehydrogenase